MKVLAAAALVGRAVSALAEEAMHVPRGGGVVVDGRIGEASWKRAASRSLPDGTGLRFQHDGQHLHVAITSRRPGFPSVCASNGETVRILHASAASGSVTYSRADGEWLANDKEFAYGMRNTELTEQAVKERRDYLERHGWLASTNGMGEGKAHELQIGLDLIQRMATLAVAYFALEAGSIAAWPGSLAADDGCLDARLVRGNVPPRLRFEPRTWAELTLEP